MKIVKIACSFCGANTELARKLITCDDFCICNICIARAQESLSTKDKSVTLCNVCSFCGQREPIIYQAKSTHTSADICVNCFNLCVEIATEEHYEPRACRLCFANNEKAGEQLIFGYGGDICSSCVTEIQRNNVINQAATCLFSNGPQHNLPVYIGSKSDLQGLCVLCRLSCSKALRR